MKPFTASMAKSMMAMAITIAAIMIATSSTIPTAVITESSEKTMSSTMICATTPTKPRRPPARAGSCSPSSTLS